MGRDGEDVPRVELRRLFLAACDKRGIPEAQQEALWARFRAHYLRDLERRWRRKFDAFLDGDGSRREQGPGVTEILRKHGRPLPLDILARLAGRPASSVETEVRELLEARVLAEVGHKTYALWEEEGMS